MINHPSKTISGLHRGSLPSGQIEDLVRLDRVDRGNPIIRTKVCGIDGIGVPQGYTRAAELFKLAADQGTALAQTLLGSMHAKGQGLPQDTTRAAELDSEQTFREHLGRGRRGKPKSSRIHPIQFVEISHLCLHQYLGWFQRARI